MLKKKKKEEEENPLGLSFLYNMEIKSVMAWIAFPQNSDVTAPQTVTIFEDNLVKEWLLKWGP